MDTALVTAACMCRSPQRWVRFCVTIGSVAISAGFGCLAGQRSASATLVRHSVFWSAIAILFFIDIIYDGQPDQPRLSGTERIQLQGGVARSLNIWRCGWLCPTTQPALLRRSWWGILAIHKASVKPPMRWGDTEQDAATGDYPAGLAADHLPLTSNYLNLTKNSSLLLPSAKPTSLLRSAQFPDADRQGSRNHGHRAEHLSGAVTDHFGIHES